MPSDTPLGWKCVSETTDEGIVVHIIPCNDDREHDEVDCWCDPQVDEEENGTMYVHNSLDRRELYEDGRLLKH